jgi:general secretion pathway protein A
MSYYKLLGLEKEPFSTSPDPAFFYQSKEHKSALYRLRNAIELRRGLSVVLGDVGAGKTTLSRKLVQLLSAEPNLIVAVMLNPIYESEQQFLAELAERFHLPVNPISSQGTYGVNADSIKGLKTLDYLKVLEKFLFEHGVEKNQTIVLLIDEAQQIINPCLEILRSLLNYESNEFKILQLVLMGQMELLPRLNQMKNFWDRIALKYVLNPLEEDEVKEFIDFRLEAAGYASRYPLFSDAAMRAIYNYTQGYPRKITLVCHDALEYLVMYKKELVDKETIDELIRKDMSVSVKL